jgi:hypothetical protein
VKRSNQRRIVALATLALLSMTTSVFAVTFSTFRSTRDFSWRFNPPTAPVADVTFTGVSANDGLLRLIQRTSPNAPITTLSELDDDTTNAVVASQVISFDRDLSDANLDRFRLRNNDDDVIVRVRLDPASLRSNILNSTFTATGTAQVDQGGSTVIDVPVRMSGTISTFGNSYVLRGLGHGTAYLNLGGGSYTYAYVKFELDGTVAIP